MNLGMDLTRLERSVFDKRVFMYMICGCLGLLYCVFESRN